MEKSNAFLDWIAIYGNLVGGAKDSANFCVRIIQQKVTSHPVEN